ncbi:MAG: hypothetical protein HQ522_14575 [Bacteroidetes bacterium]|nr:hypothetical protein [Bacteroidota bacterium]
MKKYCLTLLAIFIITGIYGQKKINFEKEKAAILATVEAEKKGYEDKNMELMKMNVVNDPTYIWIYADANGNMLNHGFSAQEKLVKSWWEDSETKFPDQKITTDFIELKIFPKTAWAVINVVWETIESGQVIDKRTGIETLFFEKENGKWEIACHNVLDTSSYKK